MILLNVPDRLYQAVVEYYTLLKFYLISSQQGESYLLCKDSVSSQAIGITIRSIGSASGNGPSLHDLVGQIDQVSPDDITTKSFVIKFSSSHWHEVKAQLDGIAYPYKVTRGSDGKDSLVTHDPNHTCLQLIMSEHHDSTELVSIPAFVSNGAPERKLAILTSGGDAPGMNAALRSIVRIALVNGSQPYAVMEGYQGLVSGGDMIKRLYWDDVQGILDVGGTIIGTARCMEFRERSGRKMAAKNLASLGIDALVVIGGDGSLTGADILREEWTELLQELLKDGAITDEQCKHAGLLTIVGLVGSIDNDMCTTDITIGAVTSVHRICEAVDSISSTAMSHQRAFVIEVMGRNCGWLALMSAISCGADWLFIPEQPPAENWEDGMCALLHRHREMGKRKSIIIVAEGALDRNLKPIRPDYIRDLICKRLKVDTRVTTLGHVQRGGPPAALDRYLATVQGVKAVQTLLSSNHVEPTLIGMSDNKVTAVPLMEAVELTRTVAKNIASKEFEKALELRDPEFLASLDAFTWTLRDTGDDKVPKEKRLRIAIVHTGAPSGGMNAATRSAVRYALNRGHEPLVVHNGFAGLIAGDVHPVLWMDVDSWTVFGGSKLGTNRSQPSDDIALCAYQLQKSNIQGLMIIGGFEAYTALKELFEARSIYPAFCIPLVLVPATISNNVPGTEISLGCDTALNVIVEACDRIRQSAYSSRKRVFVVEVQGARCGFLATMAGLMCGATCAYIPEEGISLQTLAEDAQHLVEKFNEGQNQGRVILRNEYASETYTTDIISAIFRDEGKGVFDSRSSILGHIQQGGAPSPMDRVRATRFAVSSVKFIEEMAFISINQHIEQTKRGRHSDVIPNENVDPPFPLPTRVSAVTGGVYTSAANTAVVAGIHRGTNIKMTPIEELIPHTDFKNRKAKHAWWLELNGLIRTLAKHERHDHAKE